VMATAGISAPAALASTQPRLDSPCVIGRDYGPVHLDSNDNPSVGIDYQGTGNLTKVTNSPGDTKFLCIKANDIYELHNAAGTSIRMRDLSNGYTVIEEVGCDLNNTNYQFQAIADGARTLFRNLHFNEYLGANCPVTNGEQVRGEPNTTGHCYRWLM